MKVNWLALQHNKMNEMNSPSNQSTMALDDQRQLLSTHHVSTYIILVALYRIPGVSKRQIRRFDTPGIQSEVIYILCLKKMNWLVLQQHKEDLPSFLN